MNLVQCDPLGGNSAVADVVGGGAGVAWSSVDGWVVLIVAEESPCAELSASRG